MTMENPAASRASSADQINQLHAEVARLSGASRDALNAALVAAWQAGRLLAVEKRNVRRSMGRGAWSVWLERYFRGTSRTAQRYMLLAKSVAEVSFLHGLSLRQAYFRLGIATEPKSATRTVTVRSLPRHITLSVRLLAVLKLDTDRLSPEQRIAYRQDLRPLYERLRHLF